MPGPTPSSHPPRAALVLLAAGSGTRLGAGTNKALLPLAGRPVLAWSLHRTAGAAWCVRTVVVARSDEVDRVRAVLARHAPGRAATVVAGGSTRHASEAAALHALAADVRSGALDVVVVHDAARPLASTALFDAVVAAAARTGAALPLVPRRDLVAVPGDARVPAVLPLVGAVQTPQAFAAAPLLAAYEQAAVDGFDGTDTAACVERYADVRVVGVPGSPRNLKVTFAGDVPVAEALLRSGS